MSVGNWLILALALGIVALDITAASPWTGLPVVLGMAFVTLAIGELVRQTVAVHRKTGGFAAVLRFEVALIAGLLGFLVARAFVLAVQFSGEATARQVASAETYDLVFTVMAGVAAALVVAPERSGRALLKLVQRPALMLASSFAALIVLGSLLLTLPLAVTDIGHVSYIDSLFTMASAVCVTGLTVNDVAATYTVFGHGVILAGVQLGGVGIMTIAALALAFGNNTSLQSQLRYAAMLDARTIADLRSVVVGVLAGTLVVEAIGIVLLWSLFAGDPRLGEASALWMATFHAITAFCNAGFSLFPGNMAPFAGDFGVQLVIMSLVVLGGLGFPVTMELVRHGWQRVVRVFRPSAPAPLRLSLATRVVAWTSLMLIVGGALVVFVLEFSRSLAPAAELGVGRRALAALFASVNTRSAGFNTVDIGAMRDASLLLMCVLMFIGGSPMSTAGGVKTTTLAAVVATLRGELRGREPELADRALTPGALRKAIAVLVMMSGILLAVVVLLTLTEDQPFIRLAFEAVSALATVGLSTGITASLTAAGKLVLTLAMFLGRVGPFTIANAVGNAGATPQNYRLAREELPIG
ncbi:MAG: TrkH family potassium uptake protein [Myxococcales bacterium]|nr:TrkH family potassium uptake protein [Myxococcales bacterium]